MTQAANLASLGAPMIADTSENVGIGTATPTFKTEIVGGATTVETTLLQVRSNAGGLNTGTTIALGNSTNPTAGSGRVELAALRSTSSGGSFVIRTGNDSGNITERMRIDSAGRVTTPLQPAFMANRTQGGVGANTRIVFPNIVFNIGSNYNSSTGLFTAPIDGRYLFITNTFSGNNENPYVAIRVNGVNRVWTLYAGGGGYGMASPNGILQLQANDTVDVYVYNNGVYASGDVADCVFSGYLLG
jgi:hypothetical protein